jgi:hypothetical protein
MNSKETTKLVALIAQLWPAMKINEFTADAWHMVLSDLPMDVAQTAVANLAKAKLGYIGVADIRHQAAEDAGLGHVEEGIAFDMAAKVGLNSGTGARMLPGAAQDAYWQMGGSQAFEGDAAMVRSRFNKVYAACCEKRTKELLSGDLGTAIAAVRAESIASNALPQIEAR